MLQHVFSCLPTKRIMLFLSPAPPVKTYITSYAAHRVHSEHGPRRLRNPRRAASIVLRRAPKRNEASMFFTKPTALG